MYIFGYFISFRIKQLIKQEQGKVAKKIQQRQFQTTTPTPTTPRPRPPPPPPPSRPPTPPRPSIDYDYSEDYYYYDDISNGEKTADLKVNTIDEDYDSFYYYSDDGEEPDYLSLAEKPTSHENLAQPFKPKNHIVTEDYYYYDEKDTYNIDSRPQQQYNAPPSPTPAITTRKPFENYDYEYYSDDDYNTKDQLSRRVLKHNSQEYNEGKTQLLAPPGDQSSTNYKVANNLNRSRPRPLTKRRLTFSKSFLPHMASPSSLLYSLLPAPSTFTNRHRRKRGGKRIRAKKQKAVQSVRPWWSRRISSLSKKQQLFDSTTTVHKNPKKQQLKADIPMDRDWRKKPLKIPLTDPNREFLVVEQQNKPWTKTQERSSLNSSQKGNFFSATRKEREPANFSQRKMIEESDLIGIQPTTLENLLVSLQLLENESSNSKAKRMSHRHGLAAGMEKEEQGSRKREEVQIKKPQPTIATTKEGKALVAKVKQRKRQKTGIGKRKRRRRKKRRKTLRDRQRNRYGMKKRIERRTGLQSSAKEEEEMRSLIEGIFKDLNEMDSLADFEDALTTTTTTTESPKVLPSVVTELAEMSLPTLSILLTPDKGEMDYYQDYTSSTLDEAMFLEDIKNAEALADYDYFLPSLEEDLSTTISDVDNKLAAAESWRHKLHVAKLAAWMKAKAEKEAADLAASIMLMNHQSDTNDYDTGPPAKLVSNGSKSKENQLSTTHEYGGNNIDATALPDMPADVPKEVMENLEVGTFQFFLNETDMSSIVQEEDTSTTVKPKVSTESTKATRVIVDNSSGKRVKVTRTRLNTTSSTMPFMNIDGINFGSDDYYDDFYDGGFPLVDDAIIPYEEDNEWFEYGSDDPKGIIIHDGSNLNDHHHHFKDTSGHYGLKVTPTTLSPDGFPKKVGEPCFFPPCLNYNHLKDQHKIHHHNHYHHSDPYHHHKKHKIFPKLLPRSHQHKKHPHLLPKPSHPPPPVPPYLGPFEKDHSHNTIDLQLPIIPNDHHHSTIASSAVPTLDVAHHGSIGVHLSPTEISIYPISSTPSTTTFRPTSTLRATTLTPTPITPRPTYTPYTYPLFPTAYPPTFPPSTTGPLTTSNAILPHHSTDPFTYTSSANPQLSTNLPHHQIVVHSSSTTTQQPLVVLLQKKKKKKEISDPLYYPDKTTTKPSPTYQTPQYIPPFSFSSIFLPISRRNSETEKPTPNLEKRYETSSTQLNPSSFHMEAASTTPVPASIFPQNSGKDNDGFRLSVLVPCNDPDTGQPKKCLLVKKG